MNEAIVVSHLGMGDMIGISPAIRKFCKEYDEIYIFTKEKNSKNVFDMYDDISNLNIITVSDNSSMEREEINSSLSELGKERDVILSGIYKQNHSRFVNLPDNFYDDFELDYSTYDEYFNLPEKVLNNNSLTNLLDGIEYNFVVGTSSTQDITDEILESLDEDIFVVNPSKNIYSEDDDRYELAQKFLDLPLFDYVNLIKNAKGIYLIDSSFSLLSKFVASKESKKYLYNRSGYDLSKNFFCDWEIID